MDRRWVEGEILKNGKGNYESGDFWLGSGAWPAFRREGNMVLFKYLQTNGE